MGRRLVTRRAMGIAMGVVVGLLAASCRADGGSQASSSQVPPPGTDVGQGSVLASDAGPFGSTPNGTVPLRAATGLLDGWNVVSPAPDRYTNDNNALLHDFGQDVTMAFGSKGSPVVVWASLTDPTSNGYTISSADLGPDDRWQPPVEITRTRLAPGPTGPMLSSAGDPTTNVVAIVTERRDDNGVATGVDLYLSADSGKSWAKTGVTDAEAYRPTVAMSGSNLFVSFLGVSGTVLTSATLPAVKRDAKDALDGADLRTMTWATQPVPDPEGTTAALGQPIVGVDSHGQPAVVAEFAAPTRNRRIVAFWRPGSNRPQSVTETAASVGSTDIVGLVFRDDDPIVSVAHSDTSDVNVARVAVSADGGTTFLPPVDVPGRDKERAPFGVTMAISAAADATGATSDTTAPDAPRSVGLAYLPDVAAPFDDTDGCGLPRLTTSTNLTDWTVCGPTPEDRRDPRSAVQPANVFQGVVAGPDGAFYLPVTNRNPEGTLPAGIVVWRQAPA